MHIRYFERRGSIWLDFRDEAGKRHRVPSGTLSEAEARKAAPRVIAEALAKAIKAPVRPEHSTSGEVPPKASMSIRAAYEAAMKTHKRWVESNDPDTIRHMQNKIEAYWGPDTPIHKVTKEKVLNWRAEMKRSPGIRKGTTMAHSTINHHLSHLTVLQKAAGVPLHGVEFLSVKGNERQRRVSDQELDEVLDWLRKKYAELKANPKAKMWKGLDRMPEYVELALMTTARRCELSRLVWKDVYLDKGFFVVRKGKNGGSREVPLSPDAVSILEDLKARRETERVFEDLTYSQVGSIWVKAREALGKGDDWEFIPHVATRHEGLSRMSEVGTNNAILQAQGGHESLAALKRYTRPHRAAVQAAAACIRSRHRRDNPRDGTDAEMEQTDLQSGA